jgi:hypothetical protein
MFDLKDVVPTRSGIHVVTEYLVCVSHYAGIGLSLLPLRQVTSDVGFMRHRTPDALLGQTQYDLSIDTWPASFAMAARSIDTTLFAGWSSSHDLKAFRDSVGRYERPRETGTEDGPSRMQRNLEMRISDGTLAPKAPREAGMGPMATTHRTARRLLRKEKRKKAVCEAATTTETRAE